MTHLDTKDRLNALREVAELLTVLGDDTDELVNTIWHSLNCAAGEIVTIVTLLEHPKRNRREIREWCRDVERLGWTDCYDG